ncbi:DAK2 domain-containing protein [Mycolicibacterium mengxianglii]|uniref:DAK2 domain-containing protein n=1 Tax=Mycolicibacterium mengxianglii TaxID=2736649 RepID=UPI0018D184CA|nr:DAK2 domain-containing protein [Mycolicibacterium mengxianglii]
MFDGLRVLHRYADLVAEWHDGLTALDRQAGDGDFGDNLREGLTLALVELDKPHSEQLNDFQIAAEVFLDHVGGTSGPLFGLLFRGIGSHADLAEGVAEGLAAIQRVGEAKVGDRTLVDALAPAADALAGGKSHVEAAEAAIAGAAATATQRPRMGRASYVGERAYGHADAGAVGVAMLFVALCGDDAAAAGLSLDDLLPS